MLSAAELEELAAAFEPAHYSLGQTVVRAGDECDAFYVIYSGRAELSQSGLTARSSSARSTAVIT